MEKRTIEVKYEAGRGREPKNEVEELVSAAFDTAVNLLAEYAVRAKFAEMRQTALNYGVPADRLPTDEKLMGGGTYAEFLPHSHEGIAFVRDAFAAFIGQVEKDSARGLDLLQMSGETDVEGLITKLLGGNA